MSRLLRLFSVRANIWKGLACTFLLFWTGGTSISRSLAIDDTKYGSETRVSLISDGDETLLVTHFLERLEQKAKKNRLDRKENRRRVEKEECGRLTSLVCQSSCGRILEILSQVSQRKLCWAAASRAFDKKFESFYRFKFLKAVNFFSANWQLLTDELFKCRWFWGRTAIWNKTLNKELRNIFH